MKVRPKCITESKREVLMDVTFRMSATSSSALDSFTDNGSIIYGSVEIRKTLAGTRCHRSLVRNLVWSVRTLLTYK